MKKVVIVGGMAVGCKTGARLKRIMPDAEVKIIERKSFVSYGSCGMPLFAAGEVDAFLDLASTPWGVIRGKEFFKDVKDIDVLTETELINIDKDKKKLICEDVKTGDKFFLEYDELVLGTGAKPAPAPFPCPESENISTFHNPLDARKFRQLAQRGVIGNAVIIGGGYIGCELAEALVSLWGIEAAIVEMEDRLLPRCMDIEISKILEKTLADEDINLHLSTSVEKIEIDSEGNPMVFMDSGELIKTDHVFLCLGINPETALADSIGVELGETGAIKVDEQMQTNIPGILAGGDCVEIKNIMTGNAGYFALGSLANRQGKVIADTIAGRKSTFNGSVGTISMKIFGMTSASCGISENEAQKLGLDYSMVCGTWYDRPDYHPDSKTLFGKMIYEKDSMKLLGLQLIGKGEVTRYIDAYSVYLTNGASVNDLNNFEHAYMPAHSGPMNPLNFLGSMAQAQEEDGIRCISPFSDEVSNFAQVLDVREESEVEAFPYSDSAKLFPSGVYRKELDNFDKDKDLLIVCQKGPRSYEAARTCQAAGFKNAAYLGGGIQLLKQIFDAED